MTLYEDRLFIIRELLLQLAEDLKTVAIPKTLELHLFAQLPLFVWMFLITNSSRPMRFQSDSFAVIDRIWSRLLGAEALRFVAQIR